MSEKMKIVIYHFIITSFLLIMGIVLLIQSGCSLKFIIGLIIILWANNIGLINRIK